MSDEESIWSPVGRDPAAETEPVEPSDPPTSQSGLRPAWILVGALLLIAGLGIVVASFLGSDAGDEPAASDAGESTFVGSAPTSQPSDGDVAVEAATTDQGGWPSATIARPAALGTNDAQPDGESVDLAPGLYVWGDFDGWHVWAVREPGGAPIAGLVTSTDVMARANLEGESAGDLDLEGEKFTFELGTGDRVVDGISFNPGFFVTDIIVQTGDPSIPVYTGFEAVPSANPLLVRRGS